PERLETLGDLGYSGLGFTQLGQCPASKHPARGDLEGESSTRADGNRLFATLVHHRHVPLEALDLGGPIEREPNTERLSELFGEAEVVERQPGGTVPVAEGPQDHGRMRPGGHAGVESVHDPERAMERVGERYGLLEVV